MTGEQVQDTFDWMNDEAVTAEGIKFDLTERYTFELIFDKVSLHSLKRGDGTYVTRKDGSISKMYTVPFAETQTNVQFKIEDFHNEDKNGKTVIYKDSTLWKLAEKLGYNPVLGGGFKLSDFLKPGLRITAMLVELPPNPKGKVYNTIDVDSILVDTEGGAAEPTEKIPDAVIKEVTALAKGCKKISDLTAKINKMGAKDASKFALLQPAMQLVEQGAIKF